MAKNVYETHNLDEAVFMIIGGFKPKKIEKIGSVTARFTFEQTPELEERRSTFWSTGALINLHNWLAIRQSLKLQLAKMVSEIEINNIMIPIGVGTPYWFIEKSQVIHAIYGKEITHLERLQTGNFYKSKQDATSALLAIVKKQNNP